MRNSCSNHDKREERVVRLPSVQLIGVQKAGTSAIADWLFQGGFHRPRVLDNEPWYYSKEVHFFDFDDRYNQGLDFYAKRFQHPDNGGDTGRSRTIDATPDTFQFAERVRSTYEAAGGDQVSTVKMIVILREPVARELSLYNHLSFDCRNLDAQELSQWHKQVTRADSSIMTFDEFIQDVSIPALGRNSGPGRSTRHGMYATHLHRWFSLFDRQQILVLSYDELKNNPHRLQNRVQAFLGLTIPGELLISNSNDSQYKVAIPSEKAKQALLSVLAPHNERLYQLLDTNTGPPMEQKPFPRFKA